MPKGPYEQPETCSIGGVPDTMLGGGALGPALFGMLYMARRQPRNRSRSTPITRAPSPGGEAGPAIASLAPALLLVSAVVLVYANTLSAPLIYDDLPAIKENRHIRHLWPIWDAMFYTSPDGPITGRPIPSLSVAINYAIGGLEVRGYHLFNIAVHIAAVLALWGVLRRTFANTVLGPHFGRSAPFLAFGIALLWAIHPLQTEAVTYVIQRTELLMGLFYLLTLYCAIRAWQCDKPHPWNVAAVASCLLGMGSKEAMVSAPLMVLLYDALLVSRSLGEALRRHAGLYVGLAATWGLLAGLVISNPHSETCGPHLGLHWFDYLRTQAGVLVWYLRLCFWPHPLVISYQDWPIATTFMPILPEGLFILTLLALTAWAWWRRHPVALLGAWFFMILAPTSSFLPIVTEPAAERRMYLPLAAVLIGVVLACHAFSRLAARRGAVSGRGIAAVATVVLVIAASALGYASILRNRDYQTDLGIWTDAVTKRPKNWAALQNLTSVVLYYKDFQRAIEICNRTIELKPDFPEAYNSRGTAYGRLGDPERALADCTRAIDLKPGFAEAYTNRASAHTARRDYDQAIADCTKAIELKPDYAEAYANRGAAYGSSRRPDQAIADCTKAIELDPGCVEAYNNRGSAYIGLRQYDRAMADYRKALELKPNDPSAHYNLAVGYYYLKQYEPAWANIEKCRQFGGTPKPAFLEALTRASSQPE